MSLLWGGSGKESWGRSTAYGRDQLWARELESRASTYEEPNPLYERGLALTVAAAVTPGPQQAEG